MSHMETTPDRKSTKATGSTQEVADATSEKLKDAARATKETIGRVAGAVEDRYDGLKEAARDSYDHGKAAAQQYEAAVETYVQEQPLKSLLIAAGVGILLGLLIRRHH